MDSQIDLTEDRDFRKDIFNISKINKRMKHGKYLWTWNKAILYSTKPTNEIILTGNKTDRFFKNLPEWGTEGFCDCCSSSLFKFPWIFKINNTLCYKCDTKEDNYMKNKIWIFPWNMHKR